MKISSSDEISVSSTPVAPEGNSNAAETTFDEWVDGSNVLGKSCSIN